LWAVGRAPYGPGPAPLAGDPPEAGIWWLASARNWFTGPKVQGTPEELAAAERELESLA